MTLYALTGFSGVLAEQSFEKYIGLLVGATAVSSAVVIFAYFLGFALGAWAAGALLRRARIARPLLVYGILELLVGITCVAFTYGVHPLMARLAPFQDLTRSAVELLAVRFGFGAILILPTAFLMGASFPLIARSLASESDNGRLWILAYGSNLAGAIVAAIAGAYVILPVTGLRGAMWLCLAIGVAVSIACACLPESSREAGGESAATSPDRERIPGGALLLAASFFSGLVFFALEVLWTHLIGTLLGSSVYAFASMLAAVLIGLLLGSLRARRIPEPTSAVFWRLFQLSAFLLIAQYRLWDYIQIAFLTQLPEAVKSFYTIEAFKFLLGALMIVPPAMLLGTLYPMLLRSPALGRPQASYFVGYLNAANSAGCLLGSILGVFFFIPVLGSEWSLKLIAAALFAIGVLILWRGHPPRKVLINALVGGALVFGYGLWARWDRLLLNSGQNVLFGRTDHPSPSPAKPDDDPTTLTHLVFFEEHAQGGFTTVVQFDHAKSPARHMLLTNGKFEGIDDLKGQGFAQISFAAIPSQFTSGLDRALQIGLGTGQSAHGLARMGFRQVDIAEYAPGVVHAAERWFASVNGGVVDDPHVRMHLEDGRNFLLLDRGRPFDLISIEITSVWFAGATNLYSREFYELAKSRLRPGGAFQQWIQLHHITPRELAVEIATLRSVFPYVSVWSSGGQGMLVATDHPQDLTPERRAYMIERLRSLNGISESEQPAVQREVFESRLLDSTGVDRLLAHSPYVINTDHNRWIEYATPRYNWTNNDGQENFAWLRSFTEPAASARR